VEISSFDIDYFPLSSSMQLHLEFTFPRFGSLIGHRWSRSIPRLPRKNFRWSRHSCWYWPDKSSHFTKIHRKCCFPSCQSRNTFDCNSQYLVYGSHLVQPPPQMISRHISIRKLSKRFPSVLNYT